MGWIGSSREVLCVVWCLPNGYNCERVRNKVFSWGGIAWSEQVEVTGLMANFSIREMLRHLLCIRT